ncbi:hypothetical protein K402DRAFT_383128 [Aulographum hederae CBS 113979]|uniref:Uncharacterized protein n=1 Tax=Aulographum hederae CBS 113979 TaxID=1176131 RepID=A0A6G1GR65_9PEZI|nr:hypothetical protein K402DRAFT_383128 [Aulographum hederae CBS 113979]
MAYFPAAPAMSDAEVPPFELGPAELAAICASEGFQVLRNYLANDPEQGFCECHASSDDDTKEAWILHRDILHALIMPVVQLFNRASILAKAALCTQKPEELELAYRGDARSAFLWLQCFVTEEEDWCFTRGCPACITAHTISSESTIRAAITSVLLSSSHTPSPSPSTTPSCADSDLEDSAISLSPITATPSSDLSLPSFSAFLPSLAHAISTDPFWGPSHYDHLLRKSHVLHSSLQDLILQSADLAILVEETPTNTSSSPACLSPLECRAIANGERVRPVGCKVKRGRLAKRQARLEEEEKMLLARVVWQAWSAVVVPPAERLKLRASGRRRGEGQMRRRSLTCP